MTAKRQRFTIYVPAKDQATYARFQLAACQRGKKSADLIGDAMRLWLAAELLREDGEQ